MDLYKKAGVDIAAGDIASTRAAEAAKKTFSSRTKMIGSAVNMPNGFAGVLDFHTFYLVQCCDTVGTKIDLAEKNDLYDQLGNDLLAMVADDAVCVGAEVTSITNTFETNAIDAKKIGRMMESLSLICQKEKVVIAGGEIAEVGEKIDGTSWGADAVGLVSKEKIVTGEKIQNGDVIIALHETGFRCNGFSLVRKILKEHKLEQSNVAKACLRGSTLFHGALLTLLGRYGEKAKVEIHGLAHITGGGLAGNLKRILRKKYGAKMDHLFDPCDEMKRLQKMSGLSTREMYEVWNCGNGMMLIADANDADEILRILQQKEVTAKVAGVITEKQEICITAFDGKQLTWNQ